MTPAFNPNLLSAVLDMTLEEMQHHPELLINAFDQNHHVIFWNDQCEKFFGIPGEKALGTKLEELIPSTRNDERLSWLDRCLGGQEIQILNGKYKSVQGSYEQRIIPVRNEKGQVCAALNIVRNL